MLLQLELKQIRVETAGLCKDNADFEFISREAVVGGRKDFPNPIVCLGQDNGKEKVQRLRIHRERVSDLRNSLLCGDGKNGTAIQQGSTRKKRR